MKRWCEHCKAVREIVDTVAQEKESWFCHECGGPLFGPNTPGETFRFLASVWDVERAKRLIAGRAPNARFSTERGHHWFGPKPADQEASGNLDSRSSRPASLIRIYPDYTMSEVVDLSVPVIVASLQENEEMRHLLIEGWHRYYKAWRLGVAELPAYLLSLEESRQIRLR